MTDSNDVAGRESLIGQVVLGRYRIVRVLASGGMGVIYLARGEGAEGFVKPVVVKRMLGEQVADNTMVRMFKREAKIMSNLRHPNIVSVLDFGLDRSGYYMVLDYVHGFHLGKWYRFVRDSRGRFAPQLAIHIMIHVLEALQYAHTLSDAEGKPLNIVHRDVSPSNILIDVSGHVQLADFGIARMQSEATEFRTTETSIKGKFPYLPPELLQGGDPTPASDVYACAVVLHEVISGTNEFRKKDYTSTIAQVHHHTLSSLEALGPDVPRGLDAILAKAIAKDRAARYASAYEFAQGLKSVRTQTSDVLDSELAETVSRDFLSDAMASAAKQPPLAELARAWREPPGEAAQGAGIYGSFPPPGDDATKLARPGGDRGLQKRPPRRSIALGATAAAAIAALALAAALYFRAPPAAPASITIYQTPRVPEPTDTVPASTVARDDAHAAQNQEAIVPNDTDAAEPHEPRPPHRPARGPRASSDLATDELSRALVKHRDAMNQCFASAVRDVEGSPQIRLRFEIDASGAPKSVALLPDIVAKTELGKCLLAVVRNTQFPQQKTDTSFVVPVIMARSRPK